MALQSSELSLNSPKGGLHKFTSGYCVQLKTSAVSCSRRQGSVPPGWSACGQWVCLCPAGGSANYGHPRKVTQLSDQAFWACEALKRESPFASKGSRWQE
jgi:hypothetical protein